MIAHLGLTATREGLTFAQEGAVTRFFRDEFPNITALHHGDCVGGDAWVDALVRSRNKTKQKPIHRWIHPPSNSSLRAFCDKHDPETCTVLPAKPYLSRNSDIVKAVELLLAISKTRAEQERSGTWSTIRYALRSQRIPVWIVFPNGKVEKRA